MQNQNNTTYPRGQTTILSAKFPAVSTSKTTTNNQANQILNTNTIPQQITKLITPTKLNHKPSKSKLNQPNPATTHYNILTIKIIMRKSKSQTQTFPKPTKLQAIIIVHNNEPTTTNPTSKTTKILHMNHPPKVITQKKNKIKRTLLHSPHTHYQQIISHTKSVKTVSQSNKHLTQHPNNTLVYNTPKQSTSNQIQPTKISNLAHKKRQRNNPKKPKQSNHHPKPKPIYPNLIQQSSNPNCFNSNPPTTPPKEPSRTHPKHRPHYTKTIHKSNS